METVKIDSLLSKNSKVSHPYQFLLPHDIPGFSGFHPSYYIIVELTSLSSSLNTLKQSRLFLKHPKVICQLFRITTLHMPLIVLQSRIVCVCDSMAAVS